MKYLSRSVLLLAVVLSGCGGLQEMWEGPGAESFHPKSIAVLPPNVGEFEAARDEVQDVLAAMLSKKATYERVVSPEQVVTTFQASKDAFDALVVLNGKLDTTGQPDKEAAIKLGQALNADALLAVKVNSWQHTRVEGDNIAKVGLGFRLIDAKSGTVVWKGRHQRTKSYMFFKPSLKDVAADLAEEMLKYMPR